MLRLVLQKIRGNLWKALCLLAGSLLVVGMICAIPVYTDGILQRMLTKDLEASQVASGRYPGYVSLSRDLYYAGTQVTDAVLQGLRNDFASTFQKMPFAPSVGEEELGITNLAWKATIDGNPRSFRFEMGGWTHFPDHVTIVKGRMYRTDAADGVVEAIASDLALQASGMVLDRDYEIYSYLQKAGEPSAVKVRVVGVYAATDPQELYWFRSVDSLSTSLMVDPALLVGMSDRNPTLSVMKQTVFSAYEYHGFRIQALAGLQDAIARGKALKAAQPSLTLEFRAGDVLAKYATRAAELRLTLQILVVPILLMLLFYLFMVSQLSVRSEAAAISVLESRGAGRSRILGLYGLEALLLAGVTLAGGIPLGFGLVRVIGASNGFLEFVGRKALPLAMSWQAFFYALGAVLLFLATTMLPILLQSRTSIVQQKQRKSRRPRAPFWQRIFLDAILLAVGLYGHFRMKAQLEVQRTTGLTGTGTDLDVLLFLASTVFLFGAGLLFLRIHPWLLRLLNALGRKVWGPVPYATFHRLIRSDGQEQFLLLFLVLTLAIGLFNANAARTINRNVEDSIRCAVGADAVLREQWTKYDQDGNVYIQDMALSGPTMGDAPAAVVTHYVEPDFGRFTTLPGVESATRVYRTDKVVLQQGGVRATPSLMAIDPYDFGRTAWTRGDLNVHAMNEYLNVMIQMPNAVLVSSDLKEKLGLAVGDSIVYTVDGYDDVEGVVVAFIDSWPGFRPQTLDVGGKLLTHSLIVARLDHFLSRSAVQPYEVWVKRSAGATDQTIYDGILKARIGLSSVVSANQQVVAAKNDPQLQGTNGALTLGFLLSMLVCAIGFLIYWILSVQGRVLQFGVFRAMGLGRGSILGMLVWEQLLLSGLAVAAGILVGAVASALYVPLFQLVFSTADQPLPFRVVSSPVDSLRVLAVFGGLLLACFAVLARQVMRIRIDQAVKLGEE